MRLGKKISTEARTVGQDTSHGSNGMPDDEEELIIDGSVIGGINYSERRNISNNEFLNVNGFYHRDGVLTSVLGPTTQTPTKPNSNRILGLFNINRYSGTRTHLRFTKSTIHRLNAGAWTAITGAALTGGDYDRFQLVFVEDQAFFNNNGLDVLQKINLGADTYAAAGNARKYKYYTVINNRIIGANLLAATNDPTEVAGCGDRNYSEWDPTVDISAFRTSLIEPEGHSVDEITGVQNADNKLMVFRSKSIVMGVIQPVASTPFNFIKTFNIGCNAPYSIQKVGNGIVWYDPYLGQIFLYKFKEESISSIGEKINEYIKQFQTDASRIFSSYDENNNEYELCFEFNFADITRVLRIDLSTMIWTSHDVSKACCLSNSVSTVPSVTIDGLGSTPIDSLLGTIDTLSQDIITTDKIFGTNDGERIKLDSTTIGKNITLNSLWYNIPGFRQNISSIELDFDFFGNTGNITLVGAKAGGHQVFSQVKSVNVFPPKRTIVFRINKTTEIFTFLLSFASTFGRFNLSGFRINRYKAGRL